MSRCCWLPVLAVVLSLVGCTGGPEPEHKGERTDPDKGEAAANAIDYAQATRESHELIDAMAFFAKDDPKDWESGRSKIESLASQGIIPQWVKSDLRTAFSGNEELAAAARDRLGRAGQTGVTLRMLNSPSIEDWETVRIALQARGKEPTLALVNALILRLVSAAAARKDSLLVPVREMAREELVLIGEPAVEVLEQYIEAPSGAVMKEQCAITLARMQGFRNTELVRLAESPSEEVRRAATVGLGVSGSPAALACLDRLARTDASWAVRAEAVKSLGKTRLPETVGSVAAALSDRDTFVRRTAAESLGAYFCPEATAALRRAANDPDGEVAGIARHALDLALRRAFAMLRQKDPQLRAAAAQTLRSGTGEQYGEDVGSWQRYLKAQQK